ncbi:bacteriocin ABC transporter ATP-binding protein [Vulcanibacillus modesticaldus]|uniref:Bacteriocin ABC transporter ATP-binding protein n=1 Tax=Vulcanibacillus modesticaldus TaxID=337097 RepID=A0A1D2YTJ1_9BACI|nr:peptidase domain-containing ABC transporter [Vulcanibacillus modesticaldus]OEF98971.1 bacteriocin ABC transporter ATP-binding protein [Vulcanibacillus modesticaldus]
MELKLFNKYHCVKQHDIKDCGPACLATVSKQYGLKIPISKIREVAGTDKQGTNAYGLIQAAEKLGFTAKGVKTMNKEAIFEELPLPAIAHVIVDGTLLHYMVIHKITRKEIIVADPAKGIVKYTPEEFFKIWTGILILLVPTPKFKKGDQTKGLFTRFFHLLLPQKKLLIHIFFASILFTIFGILGAFYFKFLIDDILTYQLSKTLHILSIGVIVLYLFKILLSAFRTQLLLYLSQKLDISLILGYYHHVLNLPMNFFGTRKVGEIISRLMDASKVREAISGATLTIMIDVLMVIIGGAILYSQNSFLFGVTLLLVPLYILIVWVFLKPNDRINRQEMENNAQLTSYIVESLNGIETVKAYNAERQANFETEKKFVSFLKTVFKHGFLNNVQASLRGFVELVGGVIILWVGAYQVIKGNLSVGQLITYNALLAYFLEPIKNLINLQPMMQTAIVAADRLGEILDLELEKDENEEKKINPASLKGRITIKNLDFRYGTRQLVLKNINLSIEPGEKIALVGESGSGKTTLVKLLMNFYQAEKGEILINDYNIQDINLDVLRGKIAYIPQDTFFFSGTIRENLQLGLAEDVELDKIIEVCKVAKAHDFINNLPLRYNTLLEENASNLSGGQRQRLAIARALLKEPDILIMDEATSNLDSITEKAISETINQVAQGITTIIIAHRLSTIMSADKIVVMDKGEIKEIGTHDSLMERKGMYYRFWKDQLPDGYEKMKSEIATGLEG